MFRASDRRLLDQGPCDRDPGDLPGGFRMTAVLGKMRCGESATIVRVGGEGALRKRVLDLGLTRGCRVTVERSAPLGDPIEISVRGYRLTIRRAEAAIVEVA